jgi:rhodanese-related sulfurtransferase
MRDRLRIHWTVPRALAAAAFGLGLLAVAGQPVQGHVVTIDTQELAALVGSKVDHLQPAELADRIIRGATDYRLIDLRDEPEFTAYHIPTAENVPIARLQDAGLLRNETIVLYSEGGIHAAQAWMLLRAQGYKGVTTLFGGLDGWKEDVVFPIAPANPTPDEAAQFARALQVAKFFGGKGRAASEAGGGVGALTIEAPAAPKATATGATGARPVTTAKKKKKEGC